MVKVPVRVRPELASKVNRTFALPVPLSKPVLTWSHEALAVAVHAVLAGVTASTTLLLPAAGPSTNEVTPKALAAQAEGTNPSSKIAPPMVIRRSRVHRDGAEAAERLIS